MIIVVLGGSTKDFVKESYNAQLERGLAEMFTSTPTYLDHVDQDSKFIREEKVKKAQSYKKKNQNHPAFRK